MIQITYEFESDYGTFRDAIYLPDDHTFTDSEIEAMKYERFNRWQEGVNRPPTPPNPPADLLNISQEFQPTIKLNGVTYQRFAGVPPDGAEVVQINDHWYVKIE